MLDVLLIIILAVAGLFALIVLAFVLPIRVRIGVEGENRLDRGEGSIRLYGGLFGVGARAHRGTREAPEPIVVDAGLVLWRWFVPVKHFRPAEDEEAPAPAPVPSPVEPAAPIEQQPVAAEVPRTPEPAAAPPPELRGERLEPEPAEIPIEREPYEATAAWRDEPVEAERPVTKKVKAASRIDELRARWAEWSPIVRETLHRLRGVIRLKELSIVGSLGFDDPALTGRVAGYAAALRGLEGRAFRFRVAGEFERATARGTFRAEWRINPIRIWSAAIYVGLTLYRRNRGRKSEDVADEARSAASAGGEEPSKP